VFFRAASLPEALTLLRAMAGSAAGSGLVVYPRLYLHTEMVLVLGVAVVGATPAVACFGRWRDRLLSRLAGRPRLAAPLHAAFAFLPAAVLTGLLGAPAEDGGGRRPEPFPQLRLKRDSLTSFPSRFQAYFDDAFGFRGTLIGWLSRIRFYGLGVSTSPNVVAGKKGWLYYAQEPIGRDYGAAEPFLPEQLAAWQRQLEGQRDWLAERGVHYLFVVAPDKESVYPEYLPHYLRPRSKGPSRLDQLVAHLQTRSSVAVLDLRGPLRQVRGQGLLYHHSDSHWNQRGAYHAHEQMVTMLRAWFPGMSPLPRSSFAERTADYTEGDLARMLGLKGEYHEDYPILEPRTPRRARAAERAPEMNESDRLGHLRPFATECSDDGLPRAVMCCDSFAVDLAPFLSEYFRRIAYVPTDGFLRDVIERERPQVVIQEMVERKLSGREAGR
jgi:hypothetical protein